MQLFVSDNDDDTPCPDCPFGKKNRKPCEIPIDKQILVHIPIPLTLTSPNKSLLIPRQIFQTHDRKLIPIEMSKQIQKIQMDNPSFSYHYFSESEIQEVVKEMGPRYVKAYNYLIPGAYKADLFRYIILYLRGGVYIDTGFVSVTPIEEFLDSNCTFAAVIDIDFKYNGLHKGLYNAFIATIPLSPIIKETLNLVLERIENRDYGPTCLYITGPKAFYDAFKQVTGRIKLEPGIVDNIQLFKHDSPFYCMSGKIIDSSDRILFYTKYPEYRDEIYWYTDKFPSYGELWEQRKVFRD